MFNISLKKMNTKMNIKIFLFTLIIIIFIISEFFEIYFYILTKSVIFLYIFTIFLFIKLIFIYQISDLFIPTKDNKLKRIEKLRIEKENIKKTYDKKIMNMQKSFDYFCPKCLFQSNEFHKTCPKCKSSILTKNSK